MEQVRTLTLIENLDKGSEKWANKLRRKAAATLRAYEDANLELAFILWQLEDVPIDNDRKNGPYYTFWGYSSLNDYARKELHLETKKTNSLKNIGKLLTEIKPRVTAELYDRLMALGWTKLRLLVRVMRMRDTEQWYERWTHLAETLPYLQLEIAVKKAQETELYRILKEEREIKEAMEAERIESSNNPRTPSEHGQGTEALSDPDSYEEAPLPEVEKLTTKVFQLYPEQLELVTQALIRASQLSGSTKRGHRLTLICMDFLATNPFTQPEGDQLPSWLARLEKHLGVKLIAVDESKEEIRYGLKTLEDMREWGE